MNYRNKELLNSRKNNDFLNATVMELGFNNSSKFNILHPINLSVQPSLLRTNGMKILLLISCSPSKLLILTPEKIVNFNEQEADHRKTNYPCNHLSSFELTGKKRFMTERSQSWFTYERGTKIATAQELTGE